MSVLLGYIKIKVFLDITDFFANWLDLGLTIKLHAITMIFLQLIHYKSIYGIADTDLNWDL